jgi:streptogramin lyase
LEGSPRPAQVTEIFIGFTPAGGITLGPDGNLWFTANGVISKITPFGVITQFALPALSGAENITSGPDGNLWYLDQANSKIGRMTTGGVFTIFAIPSANQGGPNCTVNCGLGVQPAQITPGPDGNLWFTEQLGIGIGKITTSGVITEFQVPTPGSVPFGITSGPDGNMWFTESSANKIGRVTLAVLPSPTPNPSSLLLVITGLLAVMSWFGFCSYRGVRNESGSSASVYDPSGQLVTSCRLFRQRPQRSSACKQRAHSGSSSRRTRC